MTNSLKIRPSVEQDLAAITKIYNQAILHTVATFDIEEKTIEDQRYWFGKHGERHPILVAELEGIIVGWAALSPWSDRLAYANTAEISLYIQEGFQGKGIGRELTKAIIQAGKNAGLHSVIAVIAEENEASIRMAESDGFYHVGTMKEVGSKFGRLLNVVIMQKLLNI